MELFVNYFYFSLLVYRNARDFCVVVQLLRLFVTSWIAACQASLSFSIFQSLLKLMSIKMVILIQLAPPLSSPFSPVLDCSPHQGLFSVNWLFSSGSQSIGASASTSVLPMNIQDWFPLGLTSFESPLDCTEIQPVHPKGDQSWIFIWRTDAEAEDSIFWPPDVKNWLIWKDPDAGKDWRQEEKGMTEDEMVGWHHQLNGHKFVQALGAGDRQGSLACCSPWGHKESDTTEWLNWTELNSRKSESSQLQIQRKGHGSCEK